MKFSQDEINVMTRDLSEFCFVLEKEHPDLSDVFDKYFKCANCKHYKQCRLRNEVDLCSNFRRLGCD